MCLGVVFEDFTYFEAIHDRHHQVAEDEVDGNVQEGLETVNAVLCFMVMVKKGNRFEGLDDLLSHIIGVVNYKNAPRHALLPVFKVPRSAYDLSLYKR